MPTHHSRSARLLKIGDNKLTINTNVQLFDEYTYREYCTEEYYQEAWVVVYADRLESAE
jgi:hypothetical protein